MLFSSVVLYGQREAAIWYFGENAGLDFNGGAPVTLIDGQVRTQEGCAAISDFNGNLLFYTDGVTVWDRTHTPMPNGTGLNGHPSSTQSGIIVPAPGNPDVYYVFTVDELADSEGLQYSIVDLTLNGGLGDITTKNVILETPVMEKLTAVVHANGTDIWVVAHRNPGNEFIAYLVTSTGISAAPVVSAIGFYASLTRHVGGYLKFSPDGNFLASASTEGNYLQIFRFNNTTGIISDPLAFESFYTAVAEGRIMTNYGVEFSSDSSKLYIQSTIYFNYPNRNSRIYQFDLSNYNAAAIEASAVLVANQPTEIGALQLAIDGKIYVTQFDQYYLGVINNPNVAGLGAGYVQNGVSLGIRRSRLGLPPFIQTYFIVGLRANNFCFGEATEFSVHTNEPVTSVLWDFGDGNTSVLETPNHIYAAPGTYTVSVTATTASEIKTESKDITIYPTPIANTITDYEVCSVLPNHQFDLATKNNEILGGQSAAENSIAYYPTLIDAENGTNALPLMYSNSLASETVYARITNSNNSACYALTSFNLIVKQAPVLLPVSDWVVCDMDLDGFQTFDLADKNAEVLGGQDAALFSVSYFETLADAQSSTSPLGTIYTNTAASQEVFFRIENTASPECFVTGSFLLEVVTGVTATAPNTLEVCGNNSDGFFVFDLSLQNATVLGAQNPAAHTVSYHPSLTDAEAGTITLNAAAYTNTIPYQQTLYVRVVNNSNSHCYATTQFDIRVYDTPVQQPVSPWMVCDMDNDGFHSFDLTEKDTEVMGGQSPIDFEIAYFHTEQDAVSSQNPILGVFQNTSNPQQLFYRIQNRNNAACFLTDSFSLHLFDAPIAYVPEPLILCDTNETGILSIDLSPKDVEVLGGQDPNYYVVSYFSSEQDAVTNASVLSKQNYNNTELQETLFARIQHRELTSCYEVTQFSLTINPLPISALQEVYVICPDSPELVLDGGDFESWVWEDSGGTVVGTSREFNVAALGDYSLTVSQTTTGVRCENTVFFEVVSSGAPEAFIAAVEGFSDQVTISIEVTGIGNFEYSVDGENYQDQARFVVFPGEYTVYVRDKLLCRTLSQEIIALGYQKFFTPNGDDLHEHWNVIGADSFPEAQVYIYDRYGKLVQQLSPTDLGWNGTYKGVPLPSADYWFRFIYGNGKVFSGHFSLKR